jgi:integrase
MVVWEKIHGEKKSDIMSSDDELFIRYLRLGKKSPTTIKQYSLAKKRLDSFLKDRPLKQDLAEEWLSGANHQMNRYTLRILHEWQPEQYPAIRLPKVKQQEADITPYTQDELNNIYQNMPSRYLGLMWLLEETGMRIMEALGLRFRYINESEGTIRYRGKGRKLQTKYPSKELIEYLVSRHSTGRRDSSKRLTDGFVWPHPKDSKRHLYPQNFWYHIHKQGGHAHRFRHTFATRLINKGENIKVIQDLLGHRSLQSTQRYAHTNEATLRQGAMKGYVKREVE